MPTTPPTTTTGRALLGLLAIRSWTAYELTQQVRRALRWAWPRSEANLYTEVKRLVPAGLAVAVEEEGEGRARTRYEITDGGRVELARWLASPPSPPQVQVEAVLRVFLADQGGLDELRATIDHTRRQVVEAMEESLPVLEEYASAEPPFPGRAHLNILFIRFSHGFLRHVLDWCDDVDAEIGTWPGTTAGVGTTPGTRRMIDEALAFSRSTLDAHGRPEGGR